MHVWKNHHCVGLAWDWRGVFIKWQWLLKVWVPSTESCCSTWKWSQNICQTARKKDFEFPPSEKRHMFTVAFFTITCWKAILIFHYNRKFVHVCCFHWKPRSPGLGIFKPCAWSPKKSKKTPSAPLGWLFFESAFGRQRLFHWNIWEAHGIAGVESSWT